MAAKMGSQRKAEKRNFLRERDGDNCFYCGEAMLFERGDEPEYLWIMERVTIEHVVDKKNGGTNENSNLRLAHGRCNHQISNAGWKKKQSILRGAYALGRAHERCSAGVETVATTAGVNEATD